jgi:nucleoside-triphosphatase
VHASIFHVDSDSAYRIGKYDVEGETIYASVAITLAEDSNTEVFIINEIGKMEYLSGRPLSDAPST